ncbi:3-phosphoshikimate 1-carboxyvinyltransferase [Salmonella enterica]|uniref:3-phosphoshikimate 1-carboxyvinyltransferase n=2 Tax=Salmonella newport TaxID=108619 RepID=A0A5Y0RPZ2_SALNE|nr:3-phosphoshikimate 1-carboxyvinyltransferase [Salmonella enterica]EBS4088212.1 3-phosphoshikimate 1-carboxyvinyltransferase [Salmonella enterica subsp. enterica serovar Newport]EBS4406389.1 3-phosphoshikimate 1-carboxyvinyltransferase [Salmonella enterica subsp. enterica serovar Newport]EBV0464919.1 3-phosphoshikimate 1-carboxyvinyltransferase [Salmonella enterica subsp. enterica serovar Newport]EBX1210184.1 3-phosphoshikimate 1-carboxyvinyltransferase [Salmonella enterica subsp. enterica se
MSSKYLVVNPAKNIRHTAFIPSSKPETQRAIIAATLSTGESIIYNDLRCLETETMKNACRKLGAKIIEEQGYLVVHGTGGDIISDKEVIDALGSGLVFRVMAAITCFSHVPTVITGDSTLRTRIMEPLLHALNCLGGNISSIHMDGKAPIINWGGYDGGLCEIEGNISSQFITALLFAAPLSKKSTKIIIKGEILSLSYIKQTLEVMSVAGIQYQHSDDYSEITVLPGEYKAAEYIITGDYTSCSYIVAATTLFPCDVILKNVNSKSIQGEKAILTIAEKMGLEIIHNDDVNELRLINRKGRLSADLEFDAGNCPNIVPTLAALGIYIDGTLRVTGGAITRFHKSPRIEAMVNELLKLGVDIKPLFKNKVYDGFEITGAATYRGNCIFSSWGDHRIFMSLFVASLRCQCANKFDGYEDVHCSFPDFFREFKQLGVTFYEEEI